jgi:hypothetical protein
MKRKEIEEIQKGVRLFNEEMRRLSQAIKSANSRHKKRLKRARRIIDGGVRMTDGRL